MTNYISEMTGKKIIDVCAAKMMEYLQARGMA